MVAIASLLVIGGVWMWRARARSNAPKYRTATVDVGPIDAVVSATGTINPVEQVEVGSQVSGTVSALHADYNSKVRSGQVLLELEPSSFRARVVQNQASVTKAQAALKDARRALNRAQELFKQDLIAKIEVEAAE